MMPTFDPYGNIVIVEKLSKSACLSWLRGENFIFQKGEVLCIMNPCDSEMKLCKRLLYKEGEEVTLPSGGRLIVPKNHIWVEGDNKQNSLDSRRFGPVPTSLILGRVPIQVWPRINLL